MKRKRKRRRRWSGWSGWREKEEEEEKNYCWVIKRHAISYSRRPARGKLFGGTAAVRKRRKQKQKHCTALHCTALTDIYVVVIL